MIMDNVKTFAVLMRKTIKKISCVEFFTLFYNKIYFYHL